MSLDEDLTEILAAGDPVVWRRRTEAARRIFLMASEAEQLQLEIAQVGEHLREAGSVITNPVSAGVAQLLDERNDLRDQLSDGRGTLASAAEVVDLAKGVLVAMTTEEHPWYLPGEPDGKPGYHCPRCKALNEIEMWRRTNG